MECGHAHQYHATDAYPLSADFDDRVARLQAGFNPGPKALKGCEERLGAAVAQTNPDELRLGPGRIGKVEEIFVLADDDALVLAGVLPDASVRGVGQIHVEDVLALDAARSQKAGEGGG